MRVFLLQSSGPNAGSGYQMPLSLPSLGAYAKQKGHEVAAIDLHYPSSKVPGRYLKADMEVVEKIKAFRPDVLGISFTTLDRHNARFWAGLMKEHIPGLVVVVGGPHVSYTSRDVMERWDAVDYVVRFEGELPFAMLLERLPTNGPFHDIPGLSYREADGTVQETERSGLIQDLDTLPMPDWSVYEDIDAMIMNYHPIISRDGTFLLGPTIHTMTSRGCPFLCKFCSTSEFWQGKTRFRSPENVIEELKSIKQRWPMVENLIFHDDTLTLKRSHVRRVCELMIQEGLKFKWKAWSRLDILDAELLQLMKDAGCVCVLCGVESGTEQGLKLVGKKLKLERLYKNLKLIQDSGMGAVYSFIVGIPGETREQSLESVRLARKLEGPNAVANVYFGTSIFPGTAFCKDMELDVGPINWEDPSDAVRPLFVDDGFGNPIAPEVAHAPEIVLELEAALGLPLLEEFQPASAGAAARHQHQLNRLKVVRRWSPYLVPQLEQLAGVVPPVVADDPPKVMTLSGRSPESLLAVALSDRYDELTELKLTEPVLQGGPKADARIDAMFGKLPTDEFKLTVDLNSLSDLTAPVLGKILAHMRRVLAHDGAAVFFHLNPDHLALRVARLLGLKRRPPGAKRQLSVEEFRAILRDAGFAVEAHHAGGLRLPWRLTRRLPFSISNQVSRLRLPRSLGIWSMLVCKPVKAASTVPTAQASAVVPEKELAAETH